MYSLRGLSAQRHGRRGDVPQFLLRAAGIAQGLEAGVVHGLQVGGDLAHLAFGGIRATALSVCLGAQALDGAADLLLEGLALGCAARSGAAVGAEATAGIDAGEGGLCGVVGRMSWGGRLVHGQFEPIRRTATGLQLGKHAKHRVDTDLLVANECTAWVSPAELLSQSERDHRLRVLWCLVKLAVLAAGGSARSLRLSPFPSIMIMNMR